MPQKCVGGVVLPTKIVWVVSNALADNVAPLVLTTWIVNAPWGKAAKSTSSVVPPRKKSATAKMMIATASSMMGLPVPQEPVKTGYANDHHPTPHQNNHFPVCMVFCDVLVI